MYLYIKSPERPITGRIGGKLKINRREDTKNFGSPEIWSDKVSLLHIKGTQRGGEHGGESIKDNITEVPKAQRATEP